MPAELSSQLEQPVAPGQQQTFGSAADSRHRAAVKAQRAAEKAREQRTSSNLPAVEIGSHEPSEQSKKSAEAMKTALDNTIMSFSHPDTSRLMILLDDQNEQQMQEVKAAFEKQNGVSLENYLKTKLSGVELDDALAKLHKKDGKPALACDIHKALEQRSWLIGGPSSNECETTIRTKLSRLNHDQIEQLRKDYLNDYHVKLDDALLNNPNLSQISKNAIGVYLKGIDARSDQDTVALYKNACAARNMDMLKEASAGATASGRKAFLDQGGQKQVEQAFAFYTGPQDAKDVLLDGLTGGLYSSRSNLDALTGKPVKTALEIVQSGAPSEATQVRANTALLGNNRDAIAQVLNSMSQEHRDLYFQGRTKSVADQTKLSEADKKAVAYYNELHSQLHDSAGRFWNIRHGQDLELAKWEDMIRTPGGGLIAKLADHGSYVKNDSADKVLRSIEQMSASDWKLAKNGGAAYRCEVEQTLGIVLSADDRARAMALYDQKLAADTAAAAAKVGHRSMQETLADNSGLRADRYQAVDLFHWVTADSTNVVDALTHMSVADQQSYRTNSEYRKQLDKKISDSLGDGPEFRAARHILDGVLNGQQPDADIITTIDLDAAKRRDGKIHEALGAQALSAVNPLLPLAAMADQQRGGKVTTALLGSDAADTVRHLQEALNGPKGADLLKKIKSDSAYRQQLETSLHSALTDSEFNTYARPLLETGTLPVALADTLNVSAFHDDKKHLLENVLLASNEEKAKMRSDATYRAHALAALSPDAQQIAKFALEQDEMRPEDKIRAYIVGAGVDADEVKDLLQSGFQKLTAEQRNKIKSDYARKYGTDLVSDLNARPPKKEVQEIMPLIERPSASAEEALERSEQRWSAKKDAVGTKLVGAFWDGTGDLTQESIDQFSNTVAQANATHTQITQADRDNMTDNVNKSLSLLRASQRSMTDAAVDTGLAVATMGAGFVVGPAALLTTAVVGGAILKPATRAIMLGDDYDAKNELMRDAISGGVNGLINTLGPGEVAAAFKLGERASLAAVENTVKAVAPSMLREGAEEIGRTEVTALVRHGIVSGAQNLSEKEIGAVAEKMISNQLTGEARAQAMKEVSQALHTQINEAMRSQSENYLKAVSTRYGLNMAAGVAGGGTASLVDSVYEWNPQLSTSQNLAQAGKRFVVSAGYGALGAAAFSTVGEAVHGASRLGDGHEPQAGHIEPQARSIEPHAGGDELQAGHTEPHAGGDELQAGHTEPQAGGDELQAGHTEPQAGSVESPESSPAPENHSVFLDARQIRRGTEISVGRNPQSHFNVDEPTVSWDHLRVGVDANGQTYIRDKGSSNGTFVNGTRIESNRNVRIDLNDSITLGRTGPKLELGSPPSRLVSQVSFYAAGHDLLPGQEVTIGRNPASNINGGSDVVSWDHAKLGVDTNGNLYVEDLGSKNGTYVNGQRITSNKRVILDARDDLRLGQTGPVIELGETAKLTMPGAGEQVAVGRDSHDIQNNFVSRKHAFVGRDEYGTYVEDRYTPNGTYVNGERIPPGKKRYVTARDTVYLGSKDKGVKLELSEPSLRRVQGKPEQRLSMTENLYRDADGNLERRANPKYFSVEGNVSDAFVSEVEGAYLQIPQKLRELSALRRQVVRVGELSTDMKPQLKGIQPRGWKPNSTWTMAEGLFDPNDSNIIVAEKYRVEAGQSRIARSERAAGVFRHEFGHGIDQALGDFSHSAEFQKAYEQDIDQFVRRLPQYKLDQIEYFLQTPAGSSTLGSEAGRSEIFAEMFGILQGGGCAESIRQTLNDNFPNVRRVMQEKLAQYN